MSRWITRGLATGIRTTPFPRRDDEDASGAPAALLVRAGALSPATALRAAAECPTSALVAEGDAERGALTVDGGQCIMCGRCERLAPQGFRLSRNPRVAVRARERLRARFEWQGGPLIERPPETPDAEEPARELRRRARRLFRRSLHIRHVDAGSCNGCESELQMLSAPYYDLQRLGLFFTPTPRHADALLVTGVVTRQMEKPLRATFEAMPEPKLVVAAGVCAIGCGSFEGGAMVHGPLDRLLPVDAYVPGCPPTPLALLHGLLLAVGRAEERHRVAEDGSR